VLDFNNSAAILAAETGKWSTWKIGKRSRQLLLSELMTFTSRVSSCVAAFGSWGQKSIKRAVFFSGFQAPLSFTRPPRVFWPMAKCEHGNLS
jgi:hypothetical protein